MIRIFLNIILFYSFIAGIVCQDIDLRQSTFDFFDIEEVQGLNWEKDMTGKIDERTNFNLFLITDSHKFHGAYNIKGSSTIQYLEGEQDESHVTFYEYNSEGNFVAIIEGDFSDHDFYGLWRDKRIEEEKTFTAHDLNYYKDESYWVRTYQEKDDYLLLSKTNPGIQVSGSIGQSLVQATLECYNEDCSAYSGSFSSDNKDQSFSGTLEFLDQEVKLMTELGHSIELPLKNELQLVYSEDNRNGNTYRFDIDFEDNKLNGIWQRIAQYHNDIPQDFDGFESGQEIEIDFLGKRFFSGILRYQSNANSNILEKTFIIDLKRKKHLSHKELIKNDDMLKQEINRLISEHQRDNLLFSFSAEGLIVRTPFNLLYGQERYTLPYALLKSKKLN